MKKRFLHCLNIALLAGVVWLVVRNVRKEKGEDLPEVSAPQRVAQAQRIVSDEPRTVQQAAPEAREKIKWLAFEEMKTAMSKTPKKVMVDVYTDWCGWCIIMDRTTFVNPEVVSLLARDFYSIKFDAESQETIMFNDKEYGPLGRINTLALYLTGGRLTYPTTVIFDEELNMIANEPGYMGGEEMLKMLSFFGGDRHKEEKWEEYKRSGRP